VSDTIPLQLLVRLAEEGGKLQTHSS